MAAGRGSRAATAPELQKEWVCAKPQTLKAMGGCEALNPETSEWLRNLRTVRNPEPYKK